MVLPVQGGSWHLAGLGEVDSAELPASPGWAAVALHGVVAALHEAGLYALSAAPLAPPAPAAASEDTGSGSDSEELAKQQGWRLEVCARVAWPRQALSNGGARDARAVVTQVGCIILASQ